MLGDAIGFERALTELLADDYVEVPGRERGFDLRSPNGRELVEVKVVQGARDLTAALIQLAMALGKQAKAERATLVAYSPRMSSARVAEEWEALRQTLTRSIRERLRLVALASDLDVLRPEGADPRLKRLATTARQAIGAVTKTGERSSIAAAWTPKQFQIWMVLLDAWLRGEGPLEVQEVAARAGASAPTMVGALGRLEEVGDLERTRSRSVVLTRLSRGTLDDVLVRAGEFRQTRRFVDVSGRKDTKDLERRLRGKAPKEVALGGVVAARHYVKQFDLNGLPRVDLATPGRDSLAWLTRIDPALREARPGDASPVLVVSHILRPAPRFEVSKRRSLAGPADTLLDLHDLRLTEQAHDFIKQLRRGA